MRKYLVAFNITSPKTVYETVVVSEIITWKDIVTEEDLECPPFFEQHEREGGKETISIRIHKTYPEKDKMYEVRKGLSKIKKIISMTPIG